MLRVWLPTAATAALLMVLFIVSVEPPALMLTRGCSARDGVSGRGRDRPDGAHGCRGDANGDVGRAIRGAADSEQRRVQDPRR